MVVDGLSLSHENLVVGQGVGAVVTELKGRHSWVFYLNEMGWNSSGSMPSPISSCSSSQNNAFSLWQKLSQLFSQYPAPPI